MMSKHAIRNSLAIAFFIIFVYIMYSFLSGLLIREQLYGTWVAIEINSQITFTENYCIRDVAIDEYIIRGNKIILSGGEKFEITLTKNYLQMNDIFYWKR